MTQARLPFPTGPGVRIPVLLDTAIGTNVDGLLALLLPWDTTHWIS